MSWSNWVRSSLYGGCLISTNDDGTWIHHLVANPDEENPSNNHVHLKVKLGSGEAALLSSVKIDGMHVINRRQLIDRINNATGLGLSYR